MRVRAWLRAWLRVCACVLRVCVHVLVGIDLGTGIGTHVLRCVTRSQWCVCHIEFLLSYWRRNHKCEFTAKFTVIDIYIKARNHKCEFTVKSHLKHHVHMWIHNDIVWKYIAFICCDILPEGMKIYSFICCDILRIKSYAVSYERGWRYHMAWIQHDLHEIMHWYLLRWARRQMSSIHHNSTLTGYMY